MIRRVEGVESVIGERRPGDVLARLMPDPEVRVRAADLASVRGGMSTHIRQPGYVWEGRIDPRTVE